MPWDPSPGGGWSPTSRTGKIIMFGTFGVAFVTAACFKLF